MSTDVIIALSGGFGLWDNISFNVSMATSTQPSNLRFLLIIIVVSIRLTELLKVVCEEVGKKKK